MTQNNAKTIILRDGRTLCYREYGLREARPILYCHGFPSSSLEVSHFNDIAVKNACCIIAIDRPGMGSSSFNPKGSLSSWVEDVRELLNDLAIDKIRIISYSGGAPFLIACAALIPERVVNCAIVSGLAPLDILKKQGGITTDENIVKNTLKLFPFLAKFMMMITYKLLNNPEKMLAQIEKKLPEVDKRLFQNENIRKHIIINTLEAFKAGIKGPAYEMQLLFKPWNVDFSSIHCPISLWYGKDDIQTNPKHAETYKKLIPHASLTILDNEGHHSLIQHHFAEILMQICAPSGVIPAKAGI